MFKNIKVLLLTVLLIEVFVPTIMNAQDIDDMTIFEQKKYSGEMINIDLSANNEYKIKTDSRDDSIIIDGEEKKLINKEFFLKQEANKEVNIIDNDSSSVQITERPFLEVLSKNTKDSSENNDTKQAKKQAKNLKVPKI